MLELTEEEIKKRLGKGEDLRGKTYNQLTPLYPLVERHDRSIVWHCLCSCGNEIDIIGTRMKKGNIKSCGCIKGTDIANQRFGRLIAIEYTGKTQGTNRIWKCICDCGNTCEATVNCLTSGKKQSCGCLQDETRRKKYIDLTNQKFGKLVALYPLEDRDYKGGLIWKCKCECGNYHNVTSDHLRTGDTNSCGCIKSLGEYQVGILLNQANLTYVRQKTFSNCRSSISNSLLFFDFYVNNQYVIEFDGEQHFKYKSNTTWNNEENFIKTHNYVLIKNQYCFNNNIPIIRIPYNEKFIAEDLFLETTRFLLTPENEKQYYDKRIK